MNPIVKRWGAEAAWFAAPLLIAGFCALIIVSLPGWTWQLYDDPSWLFTFRGQDGFWDSFSAFVAKDFHSLGRVRPLSGALAYGKLALFGEHPHLLRAVRLGEVMLFAGAFLWAARAALGLRPALSFLALALCLKSPPVLEQFRWMFTSELPALTALCVALAVGRRRPATAEALIIVAALIKEPFIILLPMPSMLHRRYRRGSAAAAAALLCMAFLYLCSQGAFSSSVNVYYKVAGLSAGTIAEILRGSAVDLLAPLSVAVIVAIFAGKGRGGEGAWAMAAVLGLAAVAYGGLVLPKAWGYTYILAPVCALFSLALAAALQARFGGRAIRRPVAALALAFVALFSARVVWNLARTYISSKDRAALFTVLKEGPRKGPVATSCMIDAYGIGYLADGRIDGPQCPDPSVPLTECCEGAEMLALGQECGAFDARQAEAAAAGFREIYGNKRWKLYQCRR